jgi:hypothetical protein
MPLAAGILFAPVVTNENGIHGLSSGLTWNDLKAREVKKKQAALVLHPDTSSHRSPTPEQHAQVGISDGLVRLSAGVESVEDILSDLEGALKV